MEHRSLPVPDGLDGTRVDELRSFERDYRQKLKSYIEGQLRELDTAAPVSVSGNQGFAAEQPAPTFQGFGG